MANTVLYTPTVVDILAQGIKVLDYYGQCFHNSAHFATAVQQQQDALRYIYHILRELNVEEIPNSSQYRILYPFMTWFNRNEGSSYVALSQREPLSLLFFVHFFSVILVLMAALPATNTPFVGFFRMRAVLELVQALEMGQGMVCQGCGNFHDFWEVADFPLNAVRLYQLQSAV
jgi:hypothetical protein